MANTSVTAHPNGPLTTAQQESEAQVAPQIDDLGVTPLAPPQPVNTLDGAVVPAVDTASTETVNDELILED
jgi:hypothetical protein